MMLAMHAAAVVGEEVSLKTKQYQVVKKSSPSAITVSIVT